MGIIFSINKEFKEHEKKELERKYAESDKRLDSLLNGL